MVNDDTGRGTTLDGIGKSDNSILLGICDKITSQRMVYGRLAKKAVEAMSDLKCVVRASNLKCAIDRL